MLKSFFLFLLSILLVAIFAFGIVAYKVYTMIDKFKKGNSFFDTNINGGKSSGYSAHTSSARDGRYSNGSETIIDTRNPNVAKRKIISPDEGEYVDFKE